MISYLDVEMSRFIQNSAKVKVIPVAYVGRLDILMMLMYLLCALMPYERLII